jgi:hypothetical protein
MQMIKEILLKRWLIVMSSKTLEQEVKGYNGFKQLRKFKNSYC